MEENTAKQEAASVSNAKFAQIAIQKEQRLSK
jgi:hypothetical protein